MKPDPIKAELKSTFHRIRDGFLLAGIGLILASPHIYDQAYSLAPRMFTRPATPETMKLFLLGLLILYFFSLFLFILIGMLANKRAGLAPFSYPGWGKILLSLALGILLIPVSYLLYDHLALALIPEVYPRKLFVALIYPISASFPQELATRFALLSLAVWILGKSKRKKILANFLTSLLLAAFAWVDFYRLAGVSLTGMEIILFWTGVVVLNMVAGALYLKNGFWSSLAFKFGLMLKFPLFFLLFF